ncbi:MAG: two-component sensor histidine kinase [Zoogloeaceae bacterium]|jgi:two-component system sensor histidine kinase RstB|nr:two-component sensor histidine kinase [Zoogloeaceae bacterium]
MTGIKPASPWRFEEVTLQSFLQTLASTFFKFYFLALGCLIVTTLVADVFVDAIIKHANEFQKNRFLRAACLMTETDLMRYPQSQWGKRVEFLNQKYAFYLNLVERESLNLTKAQIYLLNRRQIAANADETNFYFPLADTNQVLVINHRLGNPDLNENFLGLPQEAAVRLSSWFIISALFCIFLWFFGRPIFRDMESLRQIAHTLGEGNLEARLPNVESRLFKPLASTLNSMADRIQHLVNVQKELSTAISHELRTPIARLHFIAEMVSETETLEECQRLSQLMENDLEELDRLLDSSLTYSRFERDNQLLNATPVKIADWVEEQVDAMRILGQHLKMELDLNALPPNLMLLIDKNRMAHAISNILRNATKYAHSRILVSAYVDDNLFLLCVDDDGIGIPPHEREHIFSAFARLDRSRDRSTGGYGLGLAISRRVLELHSGNVKATESPLGGARFMMFWPMLTP